MHFRKVTQEGRVNIPIELIKKHNLEINETVVVEDSKDSIIIRKLPDFFRCAITNTVYEKPLEIKIGEAYISEEGLKEIEKYFKLR